MTLSEMEQELTILKAQASAIERILPTLATKGDLRAYATKQDLRDELRLATEALQHEILTAMDEAKRHAVILNEATRDEIRLVAEQMATKNDLQELGRELRGEMTGLKDEIRALEGNLRGDLQGLSKEIAAQGATRRRKTR